MNVISNLCPLYLNGTNNSITFYCDSSSFNPVSNNIIISYWIYCEPVFDDDYGTQSIFLLETKFNNDLKIQFYITTEFKFQCKCIDLNNVIFNLSSEIEFEYHHGYFVQLQFDLLQSTAKFSINNVVSDSSFTYSLDSNIIKQVLAETFTIGNQSKGFSKFKGFIGNLNINHGESFNAENKSDSQLVFSRPSSFPADSTFVIYPDRIYPLYTLGQLKHWKPTSDSHSRAGKFKRRSTAFASKVLHCLDLCGGYGSDAYYNERYNTNGYNFIHWNLIDIFVYFSHHRITIPPIAWINAAHENGVICLGTIITEHDIGKLENNELLNNVELYVKKLVELAVHYGFDGYLINIEADVQPSQLHNLIEFIELLTKSIHLVIPHSLIIWYDSVCQSNGKVNWQSEFNHENESFFAACDGLFTDYHWNEEKLEHSSIRAKSLNRNYSVYYGIDVFGRGTFGGGGFNTTVALHLIHKYQVSIALFAPSWTFERNHKANNILESRWFYELAELKFWMGKDYWILNLEGLEKSSLEQQTDKKEDLIECSHKKVEFGRGGFCNSNSCQWTYLTPGWKFDSSVINLCVNTNKTPEYFIETYAITNHKWCKRCTLIDLYQTSMKYKNSSNISSVFEETDSVIKIFQSFCGSAPNYSDLFFMNIQLLTEQKETISSISSGEIVCQGSDWNSFSHSFFHPKSTQQIPRYLHIEQGGKDIENWAGHYGTKFGPLNIAIQYGQCPAVNTYVNPGKMSLNAVLPLTYNFQLGWSKSVFDSGIMRENQQNCLAMNKQSNLVIFNDALYYGITYSDEIVRLLLRLDDNIIYSGSHSLVLSYEKNQLAKTNYDFSPVSFKIFQFGEEKQTPSTTSSIPIINDVEINMMIQIVEFNAEEEGFVPIKLHFILNSFQKQDSVFKSIDFEHVLQINECFHKWHQYKYTIKDISLLNDISDLSLNIGTNDLIRCSNNMKVCIGQISITPNP